MSPSLHTASLRTPLTDRSPQQPMAAPSMSGAAGANNSSSPSRSRVPSIAQLLLPQGDLPDKSPLLSLSAVAAAAERAPHRAKSQPALPALRTAPSPKAGSGMSRRNSRGSLRNAVRGAALSAAVAAQVRGEEAAAGKGGPVSPRRSDGSGGGGGSGGASLNASASASVTGSPSPGGSQSMCASPMGKSGGERVVVATPVKKGSVYASAAASVRRAAAARMETEPVSDESRMYAPMSDSPSPMVSRHQHMPAGEQNVPPHPSQSHHQHHPSHHPHQQHHHSGHMAPMHTVPQQGTQQHAHHSQHPPHNHGFQIHNGQRSFGASPATPRATRQSSPVLPATPSTPQMPVMHPSFSGFARSGGNSGGTPGDSTRGGGGEDGDAMVTHSVSAAQLGRTRTTPDAKRAQNRESAKRFRVAQKKRWLELQETVAEKDNEIEKLKAMLQEVTESRLPAQRHSATGEAIATSAAIAAAGAGLDALALGELDLLVKLVSAPAGDRTRASPASNVGHLHRIIVSTTDGTVTGVRHQQPYDGGAVAAGGKVGTLLWEGVPDGDQLQLRFTVLHATRMASEMAAEPVVFAYRRQIEAQGAPPGAPCSHVRIKACVHPLLDENGAVTSLLLAEFIEA